MFIEHLGKGRIGSEDFFDELLAVGGRATAHWEAQQRDEHPLPNMDPCLHGYHFTRSPVHFPPSVRPWIKTSDIPPVNNTP